MGAPDNPTFDQAEAVLAALEGGPRRCCSRSGMARGHGRVPGAEARRPCRRAQGDVLGAAQLAARAAPALGPRRRSRRRDRTDAIAAADAAGRDQAGLDRDAGQSDLVRSPTSPPRPTSPIAPARVLGVDITVGDAGADPADRARRRHRHAFGDQVPQRPQRRARRRPGRRARRRVLAAHRARSARSSAPSSAASRPGCCCAACARCSCGSRGPAASARRSPSACRPPAWWPRCSIPASPTIPATRSAKRQMTGRLRRHAVDARQGRRARRHRHGGPASNCGSARRRSAASRAWSSIAPASKARARPARPTCCACPSASRRQAISSTISTRRCGVATTPRGQRLHHHQSFRLQRPEASLSEVRLKAILS